MVGQDLRFAYSCATFRPGARSRQQWASPYGLLYSGSGELQFGVVILVKVGRE